MMAVDTHNTLEVAALVATLREVAARLDQIVVGGTEGGCTDMRIEEASRALHRALFELMSIDQG